MTNFITTTFWTRCFGYKLVESKLTWQVSFFYFQKQSIFRSKEPPMVSRNFDVVVISLSVICPDQLLNHNLKNTNFGPKSARFCEVISKWRLEVVRRKMISGQRCISCRMRYGNFTILTDSSVRAQVVITLSRQEIYLYK